MNYAHLLPILRDMEKMRSTGVLKSYRKPDNGISFSEKGISQTALAAKKQSLNC